MSQIINLRQARKAKARTEKETEAAANRVHFGTTKAQRKKNKAEEILAEKKLQGHRLDDTPDSTKK